MPIVVRSEGNVGAAKRVVLAGNPNAGKTTLFNALTGSRLRTGNFHGVTCSPAQKRVGDITFVDVPGLYSFKGYTLEEKSAAEEIQKADTVVCVADACTLASSLKLIEEIACLNKDIIIYVTKVEKLTRRGGFLNRDKLSAYLGAPAFTSFRDLKRAILSGELVKSEREKIPFDKVYYGGNAKISRAEKLFFNKIFSCAFFVFALIFTFFLTFHPLGAGALLKNAIENLLCEKLPEALSDKISSPVLNSFVSEGLCCGVGGVLSFVPQIAILYLCLIFLDESGISSALSFVLDGAFGKVGLSGRAAFSLISGFGCTAAAIATTGGFERDSSRQKTVAALPFIPCGAKMPAFITFLSPLFKNPFPAVTILYLLGIALSLIVSALLKGESENVISEVAPIYIPELSVLLKKLFFQIKSFILKVLTYVFVFCTISWLLSHFSLSVGFCSVENSLARKLSAILSPLFYPMGITDWRIAYAAATGFAAKENVAATIALLAPDGLNISSPSTAAICVFFLCCPACVSAFASSVREVGFKRTAINNILQLVFAFLAAYVTYAAATLI